jgi:vancomycin resistance protein YoaR
MKGLLVFAFLAAIRLPAESVLSSYSCLRPVAPDEGTNYNVDLACGLVDGRQVGPGEVFSYYRCLTPGAGMWRPGRTIRDGKYVMSYGGGYCQVSTAIYNAVLLAGLLVIERYPNSFYDPGEAYAPAGFDAAVSKETKADFKFVNTRLESVRLKVNHDGPRVSAEIIGSGASRRRWVSSEIFEKKDMKVKVLRNPGLAPGAEKVLRAGKDGLKVRRFLHEADARGDTRTFSLGVDDYEMIPEIVERGATPTAGVE